MGKGVTNRHKMSRDVAARSHNATLAMGNQQLKSSYLFTRKLGFRTQTHWLGRKSFAARYQASHMSVDRDTDGCVLVGMHGVGMASSVRRISGSGPPGFRSSMCSAYVLAWVCLGMPAEQVAKSPTSMCLTQ